MPTRKPSRTVPGVRCPRCHMRTALCLCAEVEALELSTRLVLIMHQKELKATTNTGRIAMLALPNSELHVRGAEQSARQSHERAEQPIAGLLTPGRQSLLLFPSENASILNADFLARTPGPYTLIVPDGTWRQTSKALKREAALLRIPHVKLEVSAPSRYFLRREPNLESLATFEAIARAYGVFEGRHVQVKLERLFDMMVERTLWSRGSLPLRHCKFPIPPDAIAEFFIAGARGAPRAARNAGQ